MLCGNSSNSLSSLDNTKHFLLTAGVSEQVMFSVIFVPITITSEIFNIFEA